MQTLPPASNYPVVILGQGITALSCGLHLRSAGLEDFIVCAPESPGPSSALTPGLVTGGLWGNFSRIHHAWGKELAKEIWEFGNKSFDSLAHFCRQGKLDWNQGRRLRFISSCGEKRESLKAVTALGQAGFSSRLLPPEFAPVTGNQQNSGLYGLQDDGNRSAICYPGQILSHLKQQLAGHFFPTGAKNLETLPDQSTRITFENDSSVVAEILVAGCHLATASLIPELEKILVPVADQWTRLKLREPLPGDAVHSLRGHIITQNHSYNWLAFHDLRQVSLGGGRNLRKFAGTGESSPEYSESIEKHLLSEFGSFFSGLDQAAVMTQTAFSEIHPCDELPLIGPVPGRDRILTGSGYMNQGLSMGFFAGKCLADLIYTGESTELPRHLWPTRLRSL